jgi:2-amino-4-hydroxy-6-hydroxymethyldihydropteridine diphosphokinase
MRHLDLVPCGDRVIDEPDLEVPHPLMHERRFVLQPLAEIAPGAVHPVLRLRANVLLDRSARTGSRPEAVR